jgi:hypothetical protein
MASWFRAAKHRLLGICDWDGCRCRICRLPRDTGHEWEGCRCTRCPRTRHDWDGCHCRNCEAERHEWNGLVCRSCHARKDVRALLLSHFPQDAVAVEDLLAKLNALDEFDWTAVYDWQLVEVAREAIDCCRHTAGYDLEIATTDPAGPQNASSTGYVAPCPILIKRHDSAPARLIY